MREKVTFEDKLEQLEAIVSQLEQGDRPLAGAWADFQTGVGLVKELQETLKNAELTLAKVMSDDGELKDLELTND